MKEAMAADGVGDSRRVHQIMPISRKLYFAWCSCFSSTVSHRLTICFICFLSLISVHVAVDSHTLCFLSVLPRM